MNICCKLTMRLFLFAFLFSFTLSWAQSVSWQMSNDTGATWIQSNTGLNVVYITSLAVAFDGKLLCGTVSGGVFRSLETVVNVASVPPSTVTAFMLSQNYPNPFNPVTTITYSIPYSAMVSLKVYDIMGREVEILVNAVKNSGVYSARSNASLLASGVYFYRLQAGDYVETRKLVLMK